MDINIQLAREGTTDQSCASPYEPRGVKRGTLAKRFTFSALDTCVSKKKIFNIAYKKIFTPEMAAETKLVTGWWFVLPSFIAKLLPIVLKLKDDKGKEIYIKVNQESLRKRLGIDSKDFNRAIQDVQNGGKKNAEALDLFNHFIASHLIKNLLAEGKELLAKNPLDEEANASLIKIYHAVFNFGPLSISDFDLINRTDYDEAMFFLASKEAELDSPKGDEVGRAGNSTDHINHFHNFSKAMSLISPNYKSDEVNTLRKKLNAIFPISQQDLGLYLKKHYPNFDLSKFTTIESFQKKGAPLHFAVVKKDGELLRLLVAAGCYVSQQDANGNTALDILISKSYRTGGGLLETEKSLIDFLINKRSAFSNQSLEILASGCRMQDAEWLFSLLDRVVTKDNIVPFSGVLFALLANTHLGSEFQIKVIDHFLKKGMNVDTCDKAGRTLLYDSISKMNEDLIAFLLEKGADLNFKRPAIGRSLGPETPLDLAKAKLEGIVRWNKGIEEQPHLGEWNKGVDIYRRIIQISKKNRFFY